MARPECVPTSQGSGRPKVTVNDVHLFCSLFGQVTGTFLKFLKVFWYCLEKHKIQPGIEAQSSDLFFVPNLKGKWGQDEPGTDFCCGQESEMCREEPATQQAAPVASTDGSQPAASSVPPLGSASACLYPLLTVCWRGGGGGTVSSILAAQSLLWSCASSFKLASLSSEFGCLISELLAGGRMPTGPSYSVTCGCVLFSHS